MDDVNISASTPKARTTAGVRRASKLMSLEVVSALMWMNVPQGSTTVREPASMSQAPSAVNVQLDFSQTALERATTLTNATLIPIFVRMACVSIRRDPSTVNATMDFMTQETSNINTPGSHICQCDEGYQFLSNTCVDIDECRTSPCSESQTCENIPGSYKCVQAECPSGFELINDRCFDVNECLTNNGGCDHLCENLDGSHLCSCRTGYQTTS
ncbi:unnamed protein product, partial [Cyprideis torosa]